MALRLLGMETEYAVTGFRRGVACGAEQAAHGLLEAARRDLPHLRDRGSPHGLFLGNGARLYLDTGLHPEYATPECVDPRDVVRYVRAGDRVLSRLASDAWTKGLLGGQTLVFRGNVDYSGAGTTWGCHESYMHRADPDTLQAALVPHLVSRVVYSGAGGFDPLSAGLAFTLAPRVRHVHHIVSADSTSNRGIYHTKDEPLCAGQYHRLHVICGERLMSDRANWLKLGTTALTVALAEAGLRPGRGLQLAAPLAAFRAFAADTTCRGEVSLVGRRRAGALAIQRAYLEQAEAHLGARFMPAWAGDLCRDWRGVLDLLAHDVERAATSLDWAIKRTLYARHADRRGVGWSSLGVWTGVVETLRRALDQASEPERPISTALIRDATGPIGHLRATLTTRLRDAGLEWDQLDAFLALRQELFEIDTRFGQLGSEGVFDRLDRTGALSHQVDGIDRFDDAVRTPPNTGRAGLRGNLARRPGDHTRYVASWDHVLDTKERRVLDLTDPFTTREVWRAAPATGC